MARAAVKLSRPRLAERASIAVTTLADFEADRRTPYDRTLRDLKAAFEELGVTFLEFDELGHGVRYKENG
jgi:transcriptional regulator with XRE-family HTH domain